MCAENDEVEFDKLVPDYQQECEVCEHVPTVTGVKGTKVVYDSCLCGPCLFGEARMLDPEEWNK